MATFKKDGTPGAEGPMDCPDWFFCAKELPADEVEAAIRKS